MRYQETSQSGRSVPLVQRGKMPGNNEDPPDERIEPTTRRITRLPVEFGRDDGTPTAVLQPFSGLLQRGRPSQPGQPGPALTYLTLRSLVVQHIRERETRERVVEAADTSGPDRDPDGSDTNSTETSAESLTVRELLQRSAEGDAGGSDSTDGTDAGGDQRSQGLDTRGRDRPSFGDGADSTLGPASSNDPDTESGDTSEPAPSPSRGGPEPWTLLDATGPGDADGGARPSRPEAGPGATPAGGPNPRSERSDPTTPSVTGPDLVVVSRPAADRGDFDRDAGSSLASQSPRPADRGRDGPRDRQSDGRAAPERREESEDSTISADSSPPPRTGDGSSQSLPLSLESVDQPTLDQFVERLSDKLARHERVERERRGL